MNFALVGNKKHCLQLHLFSWNQVMFFSCPRRQLHPEQLIYRRVSVFTLHRLCFWFRLILTKTYFFENITHSSLNIIWFAILSHQILMKNLYSILEHTLYLCFETSIFVRIRFCNKLIQNHEEFAFMEKKLFKKLFWFSPKFPLFTEWP